MLVPSTPRGRGGFSYATLPALAALTLLATACGGGGNDPNPTPSSIAITSGNSQSAAAGSAVTTPPSVTVRDASGNGVPDIPVTFTVTFGGGSVTGANTTTNGAGVAAVAGWTLGTTAGNNSLSAAVQGLSAVVFVATGVAGPATQMTVNAGQNQSALPGQALGTPPSVKVADQYGNGVAGTAVTFSPSGGSSVTGGTATSTNSGVATVGSWTIAAGANTLTASAGGFSDVIFNATGVASLYHITLNFVTSISPTQQAAFVNAGARWSQLIIGELSNIPIDVPANDCVNGQPALDATVDDVYIDVFVQSIDGPGGILGQAGPCRIRTSNSLTVTGVMIFDQADLANMETAGTLGDVILHEMGHVLGIGTLWNFLGFLANPSCGGTGPTCSPDNAGANTHFTGLEARTQFDAAGGTAWNPGGTATSKVPVENTAGGRGTRDGHWRESTFVNELMTGFIAAAGNPLSAITVASLDDIGYTVNLSAADTYIVANLNALRAPEAVAGLDLRDDILMMPLYAVDEDGTSRRIR